MLVFKFVKFQYHTLKCRKNLENSIINIQKNGKENTRYLIKTFKILITFNYPNFPYTETKFRPYKSQNSITEKIIFY